MTRTRRQHWLPRASYLRHFTKNGRLTAYQFRDGDKTNFLTTAKKFTPSPENIAHKRDLYETPALPDNTIENVFADLEGQYGQILEKKILKKKPLTKKEHQIVAMYVSVLENRTPSQQANLHDFIKRLDDNGRALSLAHNSPEATEKWSKEMGKARQHIFGQWLTTTIEINKWVVLDFCFLEPASYVSDAEFITSDHPVSLIDYISENSPFGKNQWSKTAECVVALTPKLAILGNNCGLTGYREIDYNFVREINNRTLRSADKLLISRGDVPEFEAKAIVQREPQSLLLKFVTLPKGNRDMIINRVKRLEKFQSIQKKVMRLLGKRSI